MQNKKDNEKEFSTCLEDLTFAETMQKMMDQQGNGSLINRFTEDKSTSLTGKKTQDWKQDMVESIMKLHRCADCPIRRRAAAKPHSLFSRIHGWHKTWWPGWNIYKAELRGRIARTTESKKIFIEEAI
jgi:hypothetical protein